MRRLAFRLACAYSAVLLFGPLADPHAHDPYHGHWSADGARVLDVARVGEGPPPSRVHPPGVLWLRGADPSGPAVFHAGGLLPAAAGLALGVAPAPASRVLWAPHPCWASVDLEPRDPPPRAV